MSLKPSTRHHYTWMLRDMERKRGRTFDVDQIDAAPLQELIREARETRGITYSEIARLTGFTKQQVRAAAVKRERVTRKTDREIRRALQEGFRENPWVEITLRHKQLVWSLGAQGWSRQHLKDILLNNGREEGAHAPFSVTDVSRKRVSRVGAENIEWLATVINTKQGPSTKSMGKMRARGVFPLRHYTADGKLNVRTLSREQRRYVQ